MEGPLEEAALWDDFFDRLPSPPVQRAQQGLLALILVAVQGLGLPARRLTEAWAEVGEQTLVVLVAVGERILVVLVEVGAQAIVVEKEV